MRKSQQLKDISSRTVFCNKGPPDKSLAENFLIIFGCLVLFQWILCSYCNCFFVKYRAKQIDYLNSLNKLRNYNQAYTRIYQRTLQFFDSVLKETTYKASKVATAKKIFSVGYIIGTTYFDKYFLFYVIIGIHSFL